MLPYLCDPHDVCLFRPHFEQTFGVFVPLLVLLSQREKQVVKTSFSVRVAVFPAASLHSLSTLESHNCHRGPARGGAPSHLARDNVLRVRSTTRSSSDNADLVPLSHSAPMTSFTRNSLKCSAPCIASCETYVMAVLCGHESHLEAWISCVQLVELDSFPLHPVTLDSVPVRHVHALDCLKCRVTCA
jgi:hypothetical protein